MTMIDEILSVKYLGKSTADQYIYEITAKLARESIFSKPKTVTRRIRASGRIETKTGGSLFIAYWEDTGRYLSPGLRSEIEDRLRANTFISEPLVTETNILPAPPADTYVQQVPNDCDHIIWRGSYYYLPNMEPDVKPAKVKKDKASGKS